MHFIQAILTLLAVETSVVAAATLNARQESASTPPTEVVQTGLQGGVSYIPRFFPIE